MSDDHSLWSEDTPWDRLNFRYENDDVARFTLIMDGVEDVVQRLESANVADVRVALVITDYLADVLLARRVNRVIELSERGFGWEAREQFDSKARGLLRQGFNRRIKLASRPYEAQFAFGLGDPILDAGEAEVLRVAHAYRNDVYHEDRHNPSTIRLIVRAALHVVVEAWKNSLPANIASSAGADGPLMRRLENIGYDNPDTFPGSRYLSLHAGASAVAEWLDREVPSNLREDRRTLAADIQRRVRWAESMVEWLSSSAGPGQEHVEPALRWNEFWRKYGDDPELLALDALRRGAVERLLEVEEDEKPCVRGEVRQADAQYVAHLHALWETARPTISLADLPQLNKRGAGLRQARDMGALLGRYRTIDLELRVFEEALAEVAISWDQYVEEESDRRRGAGITLTLEADDD